MSIPIPAYSDTLVSFVRLLDTAEMAVRTCRWHFGDLEDYTPEIMANPVGVPSWAQQNLEKFAEQLPVLRATFKNMVEAESKGIPIEPNRLGDAQPPSLVQAAFAPVIDGYINYRPETPPTLLTLPDDLKEKVLNRRIVYWDGETYIIPADFPNSFVEVWFRRAVGYWEDGGAYPLRLEKREYGWQVFGFER